MKIYPDNVLELLQGPDREALRQVHASLELSQQSGQAVYFPNSGPIERRPDYLVALEGKSYLTLHVANQPHGVEEGKLVLVSGAGGPPTPSPLGRAAAQAVAISKELKPKLGYRIYVIPVVVFVDEGPDHVVQAWGMAHGVATLFTGDRLVDRLAQVAGEHRKPIFHPPSAEEISKVMSYYGAPGRALAPILSGSVGEPAPEAGITARQVVIQRAGTVNVYTTSAAAIDGL